jgi:hypothetical protein
VSVIDMTALRALVAEEVRHELSKAVPASMEKGAGELSGTLWTADDVAAFLKASRSWVYQQSEAGRLPCVKVVGLLRFNPAAVRAFAQGQPERMADVLPLRGKGNLP